MIDSATIEKLIERAQEEKAKRQPDALYKILNNSKLNRLKTPKLSISGVSSINCCNSCENSQSSLDGQGPYLVLSYKPDSDKWEAQSTKNNNEIFLADLTFPGLIAPGFILPGWHILGEPFGLLQPRMAGKRFTTNKLKQKTEKEIEIEIIIRIGYTGKL